MAGVKFGLPDNRVGRKPTNIDFTPGPGGGLTLGNILTITDETDQDWILTITDDVGDEAILTVGEPA